MDQLVTAVDIANAYEGFVSERDDVILEHFRATIDAEHFKALEANEQLRYIIRPSSAEKRLPHLTYAKNVQTIVQDLLGIMNRFGECVSTTPADHSDIANKSKAFFKAKDKKIAFMLDDDLNMGKGMCDLRTIASDLKSDTFIPKSTNTIAAIIVPVAEQIVHIESTDVSFVLSPDGQNSCKGIRKDMSRFDIHRARCYGNVFLAKSLNDDLASVSELTTLPFLLPRLPKNEHGTTLKASSFDCYVVGTSKITTFTKCMLEEVPCILIEGDTVTMYKPRFMYERDSADLVRFVRIVDGFVKSESSLKSATDSLYATLVIKNNHKKIEAAILSDTLKALRNKLQFVFEHLDVREILTEYLPMTDKQIASILDGGIVPTEILQGFNNSNVRFLAALMDILSSMPTKKLPKEKDSSSLQDAYVADVLTNPKYLQRAMPRKIDWCTDVKHIKSIVSSHVADIFSLFGMSCRPFETIRKCDGKDSAIYDAHAHHKLILEIFAELDLADQKITDLEVFEGEYKAKHEEYFPIWNDLVYFVGCTPLNDVASESIVSFKTLDTNHGFKNAHAIAKRYPVVASSHYLHEVSSIFECLSKLPEIKQALEDNLSIANLDFEGFVAGKGPATFRADVLVENAVNALIDSCMTSKDSLSDISALADKLLVETADNNERLVACVSQRNFMSSNSRCMGDMQDRLAMLVHFTVPPAQKGGAGNATDPTVRDKLNAYVVELMNSKSDVILQAAVVVFIFVLSNGVYKYYEGAEADTTTKELLKQIVLNTLVMAMLANMAEHIEVELCIYAMYFAYVGMAVLRLVKTS